VTKEVVTVENEGYINAASVGELLMKISKRKTCSQVTLILDNARYQKCEAVQNAADKLGIHLLYLPSYSPNLNLIERLWKFVKKKALNSKYHPTFREFKEAICNVLRPEDNDTIVELESLLTLDFQDFDKVKISPV